MDYKEYKNKIIQNMPDFNYHGMWKGSIKKHILGNPKTQIEKVDIINKYIAVRRKFFKTVVIN